VPSGTGSGGVDIICIINIINHVDNGIQDYPDDGVDQTYPAGDTLMARADHRWRPVAAIAGAVLVLAVIATAVILNGGDSASTTATVAPAPRTALTPPPPSAAAPSASSPPRETVTTVTPPPQSHTAGPTVVPTPLPPPETSPSAPAVDARTFVYRVAGTKGLLDLVSIIYTDGQGMPHTDFNVALPWSKTVVLNPGVELKSVVATSLSGRLGCAISDAAGQTVVASAGSSIIATCTR
jgi:hypothetical protein